MELNTLQQKSLFLLTARGLPIMALESGALSFKLRSFLRELHTLVTRKCRNYPV